VVEVGDCLEPAVRSAPVNNRTDRNFDDEVFAAAAVHLLGGAVAAGIGTVRSSKAKVLQRAVVVGRLEDDAATLAAVATVGPALRRELLVTEAHYARPTISGLDDDL